VTLHRSPGPIVPAPFVLLQAEVDFVVSPGDLASMSGAVDIFPAVAPEPSSVVLLGMGVLALVGVAVRHRRV
jgi:hypothetical protein